MTALDFDDLPPFHPIVPAKGALTRGESAVSRGNHAGHRDLCMNMEPSSPFAVHVPLHRCILASTIIPPKKKSCLTRGSSSLLINARYMSASDMHKELSSLALDLVDSLLKFLTDLEEG